MAIQTRGFDVNVMPQPGLADPRLVAFNPARIGQGMQEGLMLADQLAKLKAYKLEQEEKAMLAADRVNAAKAQLQGIAAQTPAQTRMIQSQADIATGTKEGTIGATNATNQRTIDVAPQQAINENLALFAARPGIFSGAQVKAAQDKVALGNAGIEMATLGDRKAAAKADAEISRTAKEGAAATAAQDADTATIVSNLKNAAAKGDAEDFWTNREALKEQRALQTETMKAQLANIQSQAQNNLAEAQMRLESVNSSKSVQSKMAAIGKAANEANDAWLKLMSTKLFNSKGQESNLMTYMQELELEQTPRIAAYDSLIKQAEELKAESNAWKAQLKEVTAAAKETLPVITVPGLGKTPAAQKGTEEATEYKSPEELDQALMAGDITIAEHKKLDERLFGKKK